MEFVFKQPGAKSRSICECWPESVRLNVPHQSSRERLKYGFVDLET